VGTIIDALENFDEGFDLAGAELRKEAIDNGEYEVEIGEASLRETPRQKTLILEMKLFFRGSQYDGNFFKHQYWLTDTDALTRCGQDLFLLGFDSNTWNAKHGKKLSVEMPRAVAKMKGIRIRISKDSNTASTGKVYHNIYFRGVVPGYSAKDNPTPTTTPEVDDPFGDPNAGGEAGADFKLPE